VKILADPYDQLPAITFWLLGSLAGIKLSDLAITAPLVLLGVVPLVLERWSIGVLSLGDDEARSLGSMSAAYAPWSFRRRCDDRERRRDLGVIGWIGLMMPHVARMLVGPNFNRLLPASMLLRSAFLLIVDTLARSLGRVRNAGRHPHGGARRAVLPVAAGTRPARRVDRCGWSQRTFSIGYGAARGRSGISRW
jgi:iron complex transport system permease protein